ncbi:O-antigen ligase [Keratinibaculum paraultunense]|uniref:O-antigen ligase n=1 Tax=Keratinibaculum paraultunense TaxID=1278232 RepID=A0A4R3L0E2_9FIRM|nr:O-antigen ligase family protein [Keratinibaculum paraultunense]QQY80034.1 O-antigen ligase family protein [Keratinibaculum paraultunense]TCS91645.1 O-antigen ligase [Keratinibaculum paraultunense]
MVVERIEKKELILPIIFGILFSFIYYKLPLKYFIFLLLGAIGIILTFYDVRIGTYIGVLILPFIPDMLNLIYFIFLIGIYICKNLFKETNPLTKDPVDIPIIMYAILILISTITSIDPSGSFRDLAIHLTSIGFVFVIVNNIKTKEDFNKFVTLLVIAATLVALYGLYQYKVGVEMEDKWVDVSSNPDVKARVYSVFGNPNVLAEYLIMIIPISLSLFWYSKKIHKKGIFLITSLILTIVLVLTLSRGGWIGFAFGIFMFVLLVEKKLLLGIIPIALLGLYFLPQNIINRILTIGSLKDSSNAYRIRLWKITLEIIRDNWLIGVGFGYIPFKATFETYIRTMPAYHSHNTYLQTMAEMGVLGLIVFIIFIFVLYKYAIKRLMKTEDKYIKTMAGGVLAGLSALLAHGAVESVLYLPKIIITFWTLVALILALMRISNESKEIS